MPCSWQSIWWLRCRIAAPIHGTGHYYSIVNAIRNNIIYVVNVTQTQPSPLSNIYNNLKCVIHAIWSCVSRFSQNINHRMNIMSISCTKKSLMKICWPTSRKIFGLPNYSRFLSLCKVYLKSERKNAASGSGFCIQINMLGYKCVILVYAHSGIHSMSRTQNIGNIHT